MFSGNFGFAKKIRLPSTVVRVDENDTDKINYQSTYKGTDFKEFFMLQTLLKI